MKLLVPTDFSPCARLAFDFGYRLIHNVSQIEVFLLNSYEMPQVGTSGGAMMNMESAMAKVSEDDLEVELKVLTTKYPDIKITPVSRYGSLENCVSRICVEENVDLIVMGSHGASGLKKALLGSNAISVVENVTTPVFCIPADWVYSGIKNILFATDIDFLTHPLILKVLQEVAKKDHATIHLAYTLDNDNKKETKLNELQSNPLFSDLTLKHMEIHSDDIASDIDAYAMEINADLMVMHSEETTFWENIFKGSLLAHLVFGAKVPLLVLKDERIEDK